MVATKLSSGLPYLQCPSDNAYLRILVSVRFWYPFDFTGALGTQKEYFLAMELNVLVFIFFFEGIGNFIP